MKKIISDLSLPLCLMRTLFLTSLSITPLLFSSSASAVPSPPAVSVTTDSINVTLDWTTANGADGYILYYAPFPYGGAETIESVDVGSATDFNIDLWDGAAFYVAITAYDGSGESGFSNIDLVFITDRGNDYVDFWRQISTDLVNEAFATQSFLYASIPDITACNAGLLTNNAKQRALRVVNETRKLHGLAAVQYSTTYDNQVQQAALVQKANNFLSHFPPEASSCYSSEAFSGSGSSNLHSGSFDKDPAFSVIGWMDDRKNAANVEAVGHRRWIINPFLSYVSFGQVNGPSALKVFSFDDEPAITPQIDPDFVAFPYENYPYLFFQEPGNEPLTPWSFSIVDDKSSVFGNQFDYFSSAEVQVFGKALGTVLSVDRVYSDTDGFGIPNIITWNVNNWQYDTWYTVQISNVRQPGGGTRTYSYDVYIDYKNIIDIAFPLETGDNVTGNSISGSLKSDADRDSFEVDLAGDVTIKGSSQFSNLAFFISVYDSNKILVASNDDTININLPSGTYTIVLSNCHPTSGSCYSSSKSYTVNAG